MILKNLFNLFNLFNLTIFLLYIHIFITYLKVSNIRIKFFLFIINIFILVGIGVFYNLDGMVMLFFMSELVVVLIFITIFSQLYSFYKQKYSNNIRYVWFIIIPLVYNHYEPSLIQYKNYYNFYNITLNDFYYIYNCYFEKQIILTILTVFLLTFYSLFFIFLFYSLKQKSNLDKYKKKQVSLLRKQNLIHQTNYNAKIRVFKNKMF